jgi:hypothetical protein
MQPPVSFLGAFTRVKDDGIFMELFFLDRDVDANNVLPDDTACSDIEVSIFTTRSTRSIE